MSSVVASHRRMRALSRASALTRGDAVHGFRQCVLPHADRGVIALGESVEVADLLADRKDQNRGGENQGKTDREIVIEAHRQRHQRAAEVEQRARNFEQHEVADLFGLLEVVDRVARAEAGAVDAQAEEMGEGAPRDAPVEKGAEIDDQPLPPDNQRAASSVMERTPPSASTASSNARPSRDDVVDRLLRGDRGNQAHGVDRAGHDQDQHGLPAPQQQRAADPAPTERQRTAHRLGLITHCCSAKVGIGS